MKVYEIMEYRNCDEHYSWGLYSTEENARMYLNHMRWNDNDDFEIIEHDVDVKLRCIINEVIKMKNKNTLLYDFMKIYKNNIHCDSLYCNCNDCSNKKLCDTVEDVIKSIGNLY